MVRPSSDAVTRALVTHFETDDLALANRFCDLLEQEGYEPHEHYQVDFKMNKWIIDIVKEPNERTPSV